MIALLLRKGWVRFIRTALRKVGSGGDEVVLASGAFEVGQLVFVASLANLVAT
jgi:hypothetical protein